MTYGSREKSIASGNASPATTSYDRVGFYDQASSYDRASSFDFADPAYLNPYPTPITPAFPPTAGTALLPLYSDDEGKEENTIPPRPFSPNTYLHTRHPHLDAPPFNVLICILTNHLRKPLTTTHDVLLSGIFRKFRRDHEIYHRDISRFADEVGQMGLEVDAIPGLHHFEIDIVSSKRKQRDADGGEWVVYCIEASIAACDHEYELLVIAEREGISGVAAIMDGRGDKEVCVGVVLRGEMRFKKEEDVKMGKDGKVKKTKKIQNESKKKARDAKKQKKTMDAWDELEWVQTIMWLRLLAKRAFTSYGEMRSQEDIEYWVKKDAKLAALEDPKALLKKLNPYYRRWVDDRHWVDYGC